MQDPVDYIPIATTVLSFAFAAVVLRRYRRRGRPPHLLWWGAGVFLFGAGTFTEGFTALFGWHEPVFRAWYVSGALLGGAPLAQGTVYLLLRRRVADRLTAVLAATVVAGGVCVLLSPVAAPPPGEHVLSGSVLEWSWVRAFSPFVNTYAFVFLVGGALYSAVRYSESPGARDRMVGNVLIAGGALLPGIGGSFTRFGHTEVLYVTEFVGICFIYVGFRFNTARRPAEQGPRFPRVAGEPASVRPPAAQ